MSNRRKITSGPNPQPDGCLDEIAAILTGLLIIAFTGLAALLIQALLTPVLRILGVLP